MPEETLKYVPVRRRCQQTSKRRHGHDGQNQEGPLGRLKHGVENDEDDQDGQRHDDVQPRFGALFTLVLAGPIDLIPGR